MTLVIFDTEYTSWRGCQENGWTGNQKKEVVQIAALKVSDKLEVLGEFNALCRPVFNPILSDYFVDLTHITNAQVAKQGLPFAEAYVRFAEFAGDCVCYSHGWGAGYTDKSDGSILEENLHLYNLPMQKNLEYRNIAAVFKKLYLEKNIEVKTQSSGQIAAILGQTQKLANMGLNPHNALYDVYSILVGLKYFYPRSMELLSCLENK